MMMIILTLKVHVYLRRSHISKAANILYNL